MIRSVVIIGGGVIGLSLAWEMSVRGLKVTLLERGRVGKQTSWAAAGILPPANLQSATDPIDQLRGLSHAMFPDWVARLEAITSIDIGFRRCGGWYLSDTLGEQASMVGMTGYWKELNIHCESVPPERVAAKEPAIANWMLRTGRSPGNRVAAWWVPDEYQIRPPRLLRALHQACLNNNVTFIENAIVDDIRVSPIDSSASVRSQSAQSQSTQSQSVWHAADAIVVCGGAWTGQVASVLRLEQSLVPIRGQILLLKTNSPLLRSIVNVGHRYVICRDDGMTLVGSCEEEVGFQIGTDETMLRSLEEFAFALVPELASATRVTAWSGFRPLTFDGFPMIGRVPDTANLFVAAGHFRSGLHLSPGTAATLTDVIVGHKPVVSLDAFRVGKQQTQTN